SWCGGRADPGKHRQQGPGPACRGTADVRGGGGGGPGAGPGPDRLWTVRSVPPWTAVDVAAAGQRPCSATSAMRLVFCAVRTVATLNSRPSRLATRAITDRKSVE